MKVKIEKWKNTNIELVWSNRCITMLGFIGQSFSSGWTTIAIKLGPEFQKWSDKMNDASRQVFVSSVLKLCKCSQQDYNSYLSSLIISKFIFSFEEIPNDGA